MLRVSVCFRLATAIVTVLAATGEMAHAQTLTRTVGDVSVSLDGWVPDYTVTIDSQVRSLHREVRVHTVTTMSEVNVWGDRVIVLGGDRVSEANVIDMSTGTISDIVLGRKMTLSPDGRFIAYCRMDPASEDRSAVYIVYDVGSTPDANRTSLDVTGMTRQRFAGVPMYPQWNQGNRLYEPEPGAARHDDHSPIRWLDATAFAFLDFCVPNIQVVVVSLKLGVSNPDIRVQSLEPDGVVDATKLTLPDGVPLASQVIASDLIPIRSTGNSWIFRLVIPSSPYVKSRSVDIEM